MIAFYESDFMCWLNVKTGRYAFMMLREWQNTDKTIKIFPESSRAQHSVTQFLNMIYDIVSVQKCMLLVL